MLSHCIHEMPADPASFMLDWLQKRKKTGTGLQGPCFDNIVMLTDSYKVTHHLQYPPGTTKVYSYFESRGGVFQDICFFGLQYFLKRYMVGPVVTKAKVDQAEEYFKIHFSHPIWGYQENLFNRKGWDHILTAHGGCLPV